MDYGQGVVLSRHDPADFVCAVWQNPDAGIWEVRSAPEHFTQSKMM